jgi:chaperone modulatory protein CbpM
MQVATIFAIFPHLTPPTLHDWMARGWLGLDQNSPEDTGFGPREVARIGLICDLKLSMAIDEEAIAMILSLVDQVDGLRRSLHAIAGALAKQPPELREAVLQAVEKNT